MPGVGARLRLMARAAVGSFDDASATQAFGLLSGVLPGGVGYPPTRGTREQLRAYSEMPWLRAVASRVAHSVAATEWQLFVRGNPDPGKGRAWRDRSLQRAGFSRRMTLLKAAQAQGDLREVAESPLLDVMDSANAFQTGGQMRRVTQLHLDLAGEAFWLKERDGLGAVSGVWPIPPDWVISTATPSHRFYRVQFRAWHGLIPDTEILWMQDTDPANPYGRGSGTAMSLADELETDEYISKHTKSFFYNRARPDLLIWPKTGVMRQESVERLEQDWLAHAQGFWRSFKPYFLTREVGVKEFDQNFRTLQLVQLRQFERDSILQTFGVPPEMLGVIEHSNRSTIDAASYLFNRYVIRPRLEFLRGVLQERLVPEFDERLILHYVDPVEDDAAQQLEAAKAAPWAPTVDEWRARQGLPPLEGDTGTVHVFPATVSEHEMGVESPPRLPGVVPPGPAVVVPPSSSGADDDEPRTSGRMLAARAKALFDAGLAAHTGLVLALDLEPHVARALAVPGGEPPSALHITLASCGDVAALGDVVVCAAVAAVAAAVARRDALEGRLSGLGRFAASPQSDGRDVIYAVPDVPGLAELRHVVVEALRGAGAPPRADHGWTPHITLASVPRAADSPVASVPDLALAFGAVTASVGDATVALPLRGEPDEDARAFASWRQAARRLLGER